MKNINLNLSKEQTAKFEVIKWLTDPIGLRGSGRTYLLALGFIMHSLNYRTWIAIYNHNTHTHPQQKRELIHQIKKIVCSIGKVKLKIRGINNVITEIRVEPIEKQPYAGVKYE